MSDEKNFDIKHGIIAVKREDILDGDSNSLDVLHFVGYEQPPTYEAFIHLYQELKNDESLELNDMIDEIILLPASKDVVEYFREVYKEDIQPQIED